MRAAVAVMVIAIIALALVLRANEATSKAQTELRAARTEQALVLAPKGKREAVRLALQGLSTPPTMKERRALTAATISARRFAEATVIESDDAMVDAAWSPDSKRIAAIGRDQVLHVVDVTTGRVLTNEKLPRPPRFVRWAGKHLVVVMDRTLDYRSEDGKTLLKRQEGATAGDGANNAISENGKTVIMGDTWGSKLYVDSGTDLVETRAMGNQRSILSSGGELIATGNQVTGIMGEEHLSNESLGTFVAFARSGMFAIANSWAGFEVWDLATRERRFRSRLAFGFATSPDDEFIYAGDGHATYVFDAAGHNVYTFESELGKTSFVNGPLVSPNGDLFARERVDRRGTAIFNARNGMPVDDVAGEPIAFSPDSRGILTKSDGEVVAWRIASAGLVQHLAEPFVTFWPHNPERTWIFDGNRPVLLEAPVDPTDKPVVFERVAFATGHDDSLLVWDVKTGELKQQIPHFAGIALPVRIARDAPRALGCAGQSCRVVDENGVVATLTVESLWNSAISSDGKRIGVADEKARHWSILDVATGMLEATIQGFGQGITITSNRILYADGNDTHVYDLHGTKIASVSGLLRVVSRDDTSFQTGDGQHAWTYDAKGKLLRESAQPIPGPLSPLGGQWLGIGEHEATITDTWTGRTLATLPNGHIAHHAWSASGEWLATLTSEQKLRVWSGGVLFYEAEDHATGVALSRDGTRVLLSAPRRVLDLSFESVHAAACRIVTCP